MSNTMYHVHIIKVAGEMPIASSQLALFFENRAFVTYDLPALLPQSASYSRRCIDKCDCAVMLVGNDYGETNESGVSQLHLSYLAAKTKLKPTLIFVRRPDTKSSRRVVDFIKLLQFQNKKHLHYYQHEQVLGQHIENVYPDFEQGLTLNKWTRTDEGASVAFAPNVSSMGAGAMGALNKTKTSKLATLTDKASSDTASKSAPVPTPTTKAVTPRATAYTKALSEDPAILTSKTAPLANGRTSSFEPVASAHQALHIDHTELLLVDDLIINYQAHAYQDGNLSDVSLSNRFKWIEVVNALPKSNGIFTTDSIYRALNDLVSRYASATIKQTMPNVHAVSRCQICQIDFEWICSQLIYNEWIEPIYNPTRDPNSHTGMNHTLNSYKKYWRLTDVVKKELSFLESRR